MCYYNGVRIPADQIIRLCDLEKRISNPDLFDQEIVNGFDYGRYPILTKTPDGAEFAISEMEWGFLPSYITTRQAANRFRFGYKEPGGSWQKPFTTLNAVGEELTQPNKIFAEAARLRRCLVPSCGFYEWRHIYPINARTGKPLKTPMKFPYHISMKDKEYFFMAGVWQPWKDIETGEYVETFAIITTVAGPLMEQIHNTKKRMPVILPEELAYEWLMSNPDEDRIRQLAAYQIDNEQLQAHSVSKDFRAQPKPAEPFAYPELPPLFTRKGT